MRVFKLLIFLLLVCTNAYAVPNIPVSRAWEAAGYGGGGTYPQVLPDNEIPDKIYLVSDVAGNFFSNNAGNQWRFMNNGTTTIINTAIAQSQSNPDILYSIGKALIKSVDRGKSWNTLAQFTAVRPLNHKCIAIKRNDPSVVYVGLSNGKIMKSSNGGKSFSEFGTPFGAGRHVAFLYINEAGTLLVAGSWGFGMVSYDLTEPTPTATTISFSGTNNLYNVDYDTYDNSGTEVFCVTAGYYVSCTDDFVTWDDKPDVHADTNYFIARLAVKKPTVGGVRFITYMRRTTSAGGANYWDLSTDGGQTYTDIKNNITLNVVDNPTEEWASFGDIGNGATVVFDPHSDTKAWIATDWRIWRSDDGGLNWVEHVKGAQNIVNSDLACSPRMSNGVTRCFVTSMDVGIMYSDDVGTTWNPAFPNGSNGGPQGFAVAGHIWRVITSGSQADWDAGNGHVVATSTMWADFIVRVIVSDDNGESYTVVASGLPANKITFPNWSSTRAYVEDESVLASNGKIYTALQASTGLSPASNPLYWGLHANAENAAAWGIGYPRGLAKCGANEDILALSIDGFSPTENGGIFVSVDGGYSWGRTEQPEQWKVYNAIAFDPTDATCNTIEFAEYFYAGTPEWNPSTEYLEGNEARFKGIYYIALQDNTNQEPLDNPDVWAVDTLNAPKTWRTTDRGDTWSPVETDIGIADMAFASNGKAYKVGLNSGPAISFSNDGITWSLMARLNTSSQLADGLFIDPDNPNFICVGINDGANTGTSQGSGSDASGEGGGSIYCTADAQNGTTATWYHLTGDLPSPGGVTAITKVNDYLGTDWLLIATDGAGTFRLDLNDSALTEVSNITFE